MKKFPLLIILQVWFVANGQIHHTLPPEASVFYNEARLSVKPELISFIDEKSNQLSGTNVDADSLLLAIAPEPALRKASPENLKTVALLILIKCSYNIDSELKNKVLQIQKQEVEEMNFDKTAPLLERKSHIAHQASKWFRQLDDQTAALRNLQQHFL